MDKLHINLSPIQSLNRNALIGKISGEYARMQLNLNEVDKWIIENKNLEVEFQFPDEVYTVTESFLRGMLNKTLDTLGFDTFVARVKFHTNNDSLKKNLKSDIDNLKFYNRNEK